MGRDAKDFRRGSDKSPRARAWTWSKDLRTRIVSGLVMAAIALVTVWCGGLAFAGFVAILAALVSLEWQSMVTHARPTPFVYASAGAVALSIVLTTLDMGFTPFFAVGVAVFLAAGIGGAGESPAARNWMTFGPFYAAIPGMAIVGLRGDDSVGLTATLFVFFVVWSTDVSAYLFGRSIGGAKLWPSVSPAKTWSGAIGGLIAGTAAGAIVDAYAPSGALGPMLLLAAALSIASQTGDLFESAMKRRFGAKDSGDVIPGHGGMMDRLDGLIAAAMLAFMIGAINAGQGSAAAGLLRW